MLKGFFALYSNEDKKSDLDSNTILFLDKRYTKSNRKIPSDNGESDSGPIYIEYDATTNFTYFNNNVNKEASDTTNIETYTNNNENSEDDAELEYSRFFAKSKTNSNINKHLSYFLILIADKSGYLATYYNLKTLNPTINS